MSRDIWSPRQYRAYASHRARPFYELLSRVDVPAPAYVVDLGCGPGERTADLAERWPGAVIEGIDSSAEMIAEARRMIRQHSDAQNGTLADAAAPGARAEETPFPAGSPGGRDAGSSAGGPADVGEGPGAQPDVARPRVAGSESGQIEAGSVGSSVGESAGVDGGSRGRDGAVGRKAGSEDASVGARDGVEAGFPVEESAGVDGGSRGRDGVLGRTVGSESVSTDVRDGVSAGDLGDSGMRFSVGDLAEWVPDRPVDVIFSNAALQWVPGHQRLLPQWVEALAPGGRLAFSMPGNFDGPSHRILRELCASARWRDRLGKVNRHNIVGDPGDYFELLSGLGCEVDAWETTYLQVLQGTDPVLEWMKGTALRPALDALPDEGEREEFLAELVIRLREAYPPGPHGTLFPFRRIFVVAGRPAPAPAARPS